MGTIDIIIYIIVLFGFIALYFTGAFDFIFSMFSRRNYRISGGKKYK